MHDYAIDSNKRRLVNAIIVSVYILLSFILVIYLNDYWHEKIDEMMKEAVVKIPETVSWDISENLVKIVISVFFPGIGIGVIYGIYDHWLWKCRIFMCLHKIPNLNGKWTAEIISPLKDGRRPKIQMDIKQTWNKIQVTGISGNYTSTASESASILEQHGQTYFSYSYWIQQLGGQGYPGFNSLKVEGDKLIGQYFSAKDITNEFTSRYGCVKKKAKGRKMAELAKGCGSKGIIVFTRN